MNDFFQILGSIASIGSIPLAIYLFIRSREQKKDKVRREIVKILSYQIGEDRKLTPFEIQTVINSKLRENKINIDSISSTSIIEDITSETISSPLLDNKRKENILGNLKSIYFKSELFEFIDTYEEKTEDTKKKHSTKIDKEIEVELESAFNKLIDKRVELKGKYKQEKQRKNEKISELFAIIGSLITIIAAIISISGFFDFAINGLKNEIIINIMLGIGVSLIASLITALIGKRIKNKNDLNK